MYAVAYLAKHDCQANAAAQWIAEAKVHTIHASQKMKAGNEVTTDYLLMMRQLQRQEKLVRQFQDHQRLPAMLATADRGSQERNKVQELFREVPGTQNVKMKNPGSCLKMCHLLISTIEKQIYW